MGDAGVKAARKPHRVRVLGPAILMAGAAIGGSHLVASTQAGARFGWQLLGILILANLFKYPFFLYGQQFTAATGDSILNGYRRLGRAYLWAFFLMNLATGVFNVAGVAFVTASLATLWITLPARMSLGDLAALIALACALLVILGRYRTLESVMRIIVLVLAVSTVAAVALAFRRPPAAPADWIGPSPWTSASFGFLLVFMGWMPAPIEIAVWPSLWTLSRASTEGRPPMRHVMIDFHVGYLGTGVLAIFFLALGARLLYGSGIEMPTAGATFARALVDLYGESIGGWARSIVAVAAFTTMFSTTLTCVDAYPRAMAASWTAFRPGHTGSRRLHVGVMLLTIAGGWLIMRFMLANLARFLDGAMALSFIAAPVFAWINFRVIQAPEVPLEVRPGPALRGLSWAGLVFLSGFTLVYLYLRIVG